MSIIHLTNVCNIFCNDIVIVNCHTYLKKSTFKENIACVKKSPEIAEIKIKLPMDRLTNLNSMVGSKISLFKNALCEKFYVVGFSWDQLKRPSGSSRLIKKNLKGILRLKKLEFGIFRKAKAWGRRRFHSTAFICRKESSKVIAYMIKDKKFENQLIRSQFEKLYRDLKFKGYCDNIINILSNEDFLIGCYTNLIKTSKLNNRKSLNTENSNSINRNWFKKVTTKLKNGQFQFEPIRKHYLSKSTKNLLITTVPSLKDRIIQEGI